MNRAIKPSDNIPANLLHASGRHKGSLNHALLQQPDADLHTGDAHPLSPNIIYVQTDRATGRQKYSTKNREEWRKARSARRSLARYHCTKVLKRDAK